MSETSANALSRIDNPDLVADAPSTVGDTKAPSNRRTRAEAHSERLISVLRALTGCIGENQALIVATDPTGFPVAQRRLSRPTDLPSALVIGRHNRCGLSVSADPGVSLRHLLVVLFPGRGPLRLRGVDLGGRGGVVLAGDRRVHGFSAHGHVMLRVGDTHVFVLPGGDAGQKLLAGSTEQAMAALAGNATLDDTSAVVQPAVAEPGAAELGGYRGFMASPASSSRGVLRLRAESPERGRAQQRDLEVDADQLRRGLLIGRYSDRCSLAGEGRNLSRVHALVCEETPDSLLVFDLASTNGVRPLEQSQGPSHAVVRITPTQGCLLGQFQLEWLPDGPG